jgi:hypothetical protein
MITKSDLAVNGQHKALGREFEMAEFKGYTVAELNNIKELLKEMKGDYVRETEEFRKTCQTHRETIGDRIKDCEDNISGLEAFKNKVLGIAAIAGIAAGIVGNWIAGLFKGGI